MAIADDQELVRAGLRGIIEAEPDLEGIGEASDGRVRRPNEIGQRRHGGSETSNGIDQASHEIGEARNAIPQRSNGPMIPGYGLTIVSNGAIRGREPSGKKLDFLSQEMLREINTMGSKSRSAVLRTLVVELKTEVERIREQVQNVE